MGECSIVTETERTLHGQAHQSMTGQPRDTVLFSLPVLQPGLGS